MTLCPVCLQVCKLCSAQAPDIVTLRHHLATAHQIDLDNPLACLVEAEESRPAQPPVVPKPPRSDDEDTSSSSSSSETAVPSSSSTPDHLLRTIHPDHPRTTDPTTGPTLDLTVADGPQPAAKRAAYSQKKAASSKKRRRGTAAAGADNANTTDELPIRQHSDTARADNSQKHASYQCQYCQIQFPNQTLYFLHRGFHSPEASNPWRCNGCGHVCTDMYDFNTHLVSVAHK